MVHPSYLMGAENISDTDLEQVGVKVVGKTDSGSRKMEIPKDSLAGYIALIKTKLTNGFWNEIVGSKKILFIFRFKDGHVEEYTLSSENEQQVNKLCAEFNDELPEKTANVY